MALAVAALVPGVVVLDASAVLALVFHEAGADQVRDVLGRARVSSVNWHEIAAKLSDRGFSVEHLAFVLANLPVEVIPVDRSDAEQAAALRASTRPFGLSLGDRACLALGRALDAPIYSADTAWSKLPSELGIKLVLIR